MSRPLLILIVLLVVLVGGAVLLAGMNTEVPLTRMERPVTNDAPAR